MTGEALDPVKANTAFKEGRDGSSGDLFSLRWQPPHRVSRLWW